MAVGKIKISGTIDDIQEVAKFLVSQHVKFKFDGEYQIACNNENIKGMTIKESLDKYLPNLTVVEKI